MSLETSTTSMPPNPSRTGVGSARPQSWWRRWRWLVLLIGALDMVMSASCAPAANPTHSGAISQYSPSGYAPYGDALAFGLDGNVWFTADPDGKIARMTPQGKIITTFAAPTTGSVSSYGLVRGSDGNIWYLADDNTVADETTLGRITMSGQISEFALPNGLGTAVSIAAGSQGPLWVTMWLAHDDGTPSTPRLLEITLPSDPAQGPHITQIALPADTQPAKIFGPDMAAGQDGSLWILTGPTTLTHITPAGGRAKFSLNIPGSAQSCGPDCKHVVALTAGPDDTLWFMDGWNHVGRITSTGVITFFPMPEDWDFNGYPVSMGAGPDGNIWFYPAGPSPSPDIGRITPSGKVTAFPLPTHLIGHTSADNIVAGSDGGVWFLWAEVMMDAPEFRISRLTP